MFLVSSVVFWALGKMVSCWCYAWTPRLGISGSKTKFYTSNCQCWQRWTLLAFPIPHNYCPSLQSPPDSAPTFLSYTLSHHPTHWLAARQHGPLNGVYFYICVFRARDVKREKHPCCSLVSSDCTVATVALARMLSKWSSWWLYSEVLCVPLFFFFTYTLHCSLGCDDFVLLLWHRWIQELHVTVFIVLLFVSLSRKREDSKHLRTDQNESFS